MTTPPSSSKAMHVGLWVAQILLAASLLMGASMKLFQPTEKLAEMWPWAAQVPPALVKFTGVIDLLGALGLILPALLRIQPRLTPIAAMGVVVLMIVASIFHISRGEGALIGPNVFFAALAVFIAWGRWRKVPIAPKV